MVGLAAGFLTKPTNQLFFSLAMVERLWVRVMVVAQVKAALVVE
jgi:hypothetical protein